MSKARIDITFGLRYPVGVTRVPFTLRMNAKESVALKTLSKIEGRPVNQVLNEAIKSYLGRRSRKERSLEANLAALRAYRKKDAGSQQAMAAFVDAEASLDDPLEGEAMEGQFVKGEFKPTGRVQSKVREMLDA
jgi:hypothetical protein